MTAIVTGRSRGAETRGKCARCGKHEATEAWVGTGGVLAWSHGMYKMWCRCCVAGEQLAYARKMARRVKALEAEREQLRGTCA